MSVRRSPKRVLAGSHTVQRSLTHCPRRDGVLLARSISLRSACRLHCLFARAWERLVNLTASIRSSTPPQDGLVDLCAGNVVHIRWVSLCTLRRYPHSMPVVIRSARSDGASEPKPQGELHQQIDQVRSKRRVYQPLICNATGAGEGAGCRPCD